MPLTSQYPVLASSGVHMPSYILMLFTFNDILCVALVISVCVGLHVNPNWMIKFAPEL